MNIGSLPTIGYLGASMVIEQPWHAGLIDASRSANVNLIIFSGGVLESPHAFDAQRSQIFELAGPENVDGLIVGSDFLGHYVGAEKIKQFCDQYQPIPLVKYEPLVEGYPTLLFDFYQGMHQLVSHLIEVHHYTRIGYITGPEQSTSIKDRYRAYQDALQAHSIPFDTNLVVEGPISEQLGKQAVRIFLDERRLQPGKDLQAIVSFYDLVSIDALNALLKRGIRVPADIAVAGFDDDEVALTTSPRLTTVRLPFYEIGRWGVDTLVNILGGSHPPKVTTMGASLVIRQSCGCRPFRFLASSKPAPAEPAVHALSIQALRNQRDQILLLLLQTAGIQNSARFRQDIEALLDFMIGECARSNPPEDPLAFATRFENMLAHMGSIHYNTEMISGVLSALQNEILEIFQCTASCADIRELFQHAQVVASDVIQRFLINEKNQATYLDNLLHEMNQEMATTLQVNDLVEVLWQYLPSLGIPAGYLALYENESPAGGFSRMHLAYGKKGRLPLAESGTRFRSRLLIPKHLRAYEQPAALVVMPLYYREEQMGFVLFEAGPRYGGLYEALREQISSALKRIKLHQSVVEARKAAEESDRLKSRFLSIVTHELRTPLSMIVSLSEMLLEDQGDSSLPEPFRQDLEVIHTTGQHLDRLVLDVLDLGRSQLGQLKIQLKPIDLVNLLHEVQRMGEQMTREKQLTWRAYIPNSLPPVRGDRTRLRQILLNLISNAAKFTLLGEVSLLVTVGEKEITIAISDTGLGIPIEDQPAIFDEFHQSERTAARGFGGMGLGLAITRRLVELHGGRINLISSGAEGSGTTFYFTLPIQAEDAAIDADGATQDDMILVIAQAQHKAQTVADYLEWQGFLAQATGPENQPDWLEQAANLTCSAILINCDPADEWGWMVLKRLREQPEKQELPILFYNLAEENNSGAFLDLNILPKPLRIDSIIEVLKQRGLSGDLAASPQTILVVDDESEFIRLHTQLIREHLPQCRVLEAQNGLQALDIMLHLRPDLVLLDLMMPVMDGFAVLEAMQQHETLRTVPVLVMTGQVLSEDMLLRLNRTVTGILAKGLFSTEETLAKIGSSLARDKRLGTEPQRIARRAMGFIHTHYADPLTRTEIAGQIGVNERYLTHCFRQEVGVTPMEYLNRYRVRIAAQLLQAESKSITEIGLQVGFSSSAHFSRVFHQYMGFAPRDYLRQT